MIEVKTQYPYIDENGNENEKLIKHYAENEEGERFYMKQLETGFEYSEAVDVYPCRYTYEATEKAVEEPEETVEETEN